MSNNAQVDVFQFALIVADFDEAIDYYSTCLDSIQLRIPTWERKAMGASCPLGIQLFLLLAKAKKKIRPDT